MKKTKNILALLLITFMIPVIAIGCKAKPKVGPDESAKAFYNYIIKSDSKGLTKIYGNKKDYDGIRDSIKKEYISGLKSSNKSSGIAMTDGQAESIYNSLMSALSKASVTTQVKSKNDKTAQVKVKSQYVNVPKTLGKVVQETTKNFRPGKTADKNKIMKKFVNSYVKNLVSELKKAKPSSDMKEKTFKFVLKDNVWLPANESGYGSDIMKMVVGQE
ncbi:DUF5105 domain-containing protein [Clostridium oryzae]|uniref:DUF5105 domain-containing protein n=1 Tax=Clostridium oryzae TaxID=1450648 RepID=A0A1V4IYV1_9CLOT|nr:DUF5105 domain-containing protein [Clostridium oryzae]OPJ65073.1 hypothetical protein CLORY_00730 [Clostridium oryzae]